MKVTPFDLCQIRSSPQIAPVAVSSGVTSDSICSDTISNVHIIKEPRVKDTRQGGSGRDSKEDEIKGNEEETGGKRGRS